MKLKIRGLCGSKKILSLNNPQNLLVKLVLGRIVHGTPWFRIERVQIQ